MHKSAQPARTSQPYPWTCRENQKHCGANCGFPFLFCLIANGASFRSGISTIRGRRAVLPNLPSSLSIATALCATPRWTRSPRESRQQRFCAFWALPWECRSDPASTFRTQPIFFVPSETSTGTSFDIHCFAFLPPKCYSLDTSRLTRPRNPKATYLHLKNLSTIPGSFGLQSFNSSPLPHVLSPSLLFLLTSSPESLRCGATWEEVAISDVKW